MKSDSVTILATIKCFLLGGDSRERMSLLPSSEKQRKPEDSFDDHPFLKKKYEVVDSDKFFKSKSSIVYCLTKTLIIEIRLFRTFALQTKVNEKNCNILSQ